MQDNENSDRELKWHKFSTVYQEDQLIYFNYYCHTFIVLAPLDVADTFANFDFYAFKDLDAYQEFVKENQKEIAKNSKKEKDLYDWTIQLKEEGTIGVMYHETYVYHTRIDGMSVTKSWIDVDLNMATEPNLPEIAPEYPAPKLSRKNKD